MMPVSTIFSTSRSMWYFLRMMYTHRNTLFVLIMRDTEEQFSKMSGAPNRGCKSGVERQQHLSHHVARSSVVVTPLASSLPPSAAKRRAFCKCVKVCFAQLPPHQQEVNKVCAPRPREPNEPAGVEPNEPAGVGIPADVSVQASRIFFSP